MDFYDLAQNRDMGQAVVKTIRKIWVLLNGGNFVSEILLDHQELFIMKLDNFINVYINHITLFSQNTFRTGLQIFASAPHLNFVWF